MRAKLLYEKAALKMLAKLTQGVNFTNILRAAFAPVFLRQKNISTKKLRAKLLYETAAHKMLVKLTPGLRSCCTNSWDVYKCLKIKYHIWEKWKETEPTVYLLLFRV